MAEQSLSIQALLCSTCNNIKHCLLCGTNTANRVSKETLHNHRDVCVGVNHLSHLCMCNKPPKNVSQCVKVVKPIERTVTSVPTSYCTTCDKIVVCQGCGIDMTNRVQKQEMITHTTSCSWNATALCMCNKAAYKPLNRT